MVGRACPTVITSVECFEVAARKCFIDYKSGMVFIFRKINKIVRNPNKIGLKMEYGHFNILQLGFLINFVWIWSPESSPFHLGGLNCALFPSQEKGAVEAVLGVVLGDECQHPPTTSFNRRVGIMCVSVVGAGAF